MEKPLTRSQRKRQAILDAATAEFKDKGFLATSMDAISQRAEVSKRTVYNHFASKDVLFIEISKNLWKLSDETTAIVYQSAKPIHDQLMTFAHQQMELYASEDYIKLCRAMISEFMQSPELGQKVMSQLESGDTSLIVFLRAAIEDGKLKPTDPLFMSTQLHYLLKGFGFWYQMIGYAPIPSKKERQEIIQSAVDMFLTHYQA